MTSESDHGVAVPAAGASASAGDSGGNSNGNGTGLSGRQRIADAVAARRRAQLVTGLRGLVKPGARVGGDRGAYPSVADPLATTDDCAPRVDGEVCDICGVGLSADHRHLLQLAERRILCSCESCWGMRSGEGDYRPTGARTLWLAELELPEELWASLQIPIGLAFFMRSTVTECVVAMYPSPGGATESELHFDSWRRMCELNPLLGDLEADIEGLIVNRLVDPPLYAIAPIDRCYELTGLVKASWEGFSGGSRVEAAIAEFFERLHAVAVPR